MLQRASIYLLLICRFSVQIRLLMKKLLVLRLFARKCSHPDPLR